MKFEFVENENTKITSEQLVYLRELLAISSDMQKKLSMRDLPLQLIDEETIRFSGVAANIKYGDIQLIVRPKISIESKKGMTDEELMTSLYLRTIKTCRTKLDNVIFFTGMSPDDNKDNEFTDCVAQFFLDKMQYARKRLPIVTYSSREEKRNSVRGKVLIQRELKSPKVDGRTWCRYKVLDENNQYNALLRWCCLYLADVVNSKILKRRLQDLSDDFTNQELELTKSMVLRMKLPRNFSAYNECFLVAKNLFLYKRQGMAFEAANNKSVGYVIDMEDAFENMVCFYTTKYATQKGLLHTPQADTILAKSSDEQEKHDVHVKPDDLLESKSGKIIIDAKYKKFSYKDKPKREDFYQMVSHCLAYGTNEAILVYPTLDDEDCYVKEWVLTKKVNDADVSIYAGKIDIFASDEEIIKQLANVVEQSKFGGTL